MLDQLGLIYKYMMLDRSKQKHTTFKESLNELHNTHLGSGPSGWADPSSTEEQNRTQKVQRSLSTSRFVFH